MSSTVPVARFMHFRALVDDLLQRFKVDGVGLESPAYGGGPFSETHFGLMMFSLEAVFKHRKDCVLFDPVTLKYLVKKGGADKFDMQRFVQLDTMSPEVINSDEADAYCCAKFCARLLEMQAGVIEPEDLTKHEKRVFLERKRKVKRGGKKITQRTAHAFRENSRFFQFSRVPEGNVDLPAKSSINSTLLAWLDTKS